VSLKEKEIREQIYGQGHGEGEINGENKVEADTLTYGKQPMEICCVTQGTQTGAL